MGIFYTSGVEAGNVTLGSMTVVMGRGKASVWRFGDDRGDPVNFAMSRRWTG